MGPLLRLLALALLTAQALAAAPPDSHERFPAHGFSLKRPTRFEARPIPAEAEDLVAMFAPRDAPKDAHAPVTHSVYRVRGLTSAAALERWTIAMFHARDLEPERSVRRRFGRAPARFKGSYVDQDLGERLLFVHAWLGEEDGIVFVGECAPDRRRREMRGFDRVAMSFRFFSSEEESARRAKIERHYRRSRLDHVEERIEVAVRLVDGWAIKDTPHSMILFHGPSTSPVLETMAEGLVAVRRRFAVDFPPDRPVDGLSVVRVCRDRGEYLTYGGNPATVGYFNPQSQELVLYDARADRSGPMPDDHPTMRTLYHEACHQFLHHTASALSPHSWFDEGTAEFYAGARLRFGDVHEILALPDRQRFLRTPGARARFPELRTLLSMSQAEFYAEADINYSLGYAFVRYLRTDPEVAGEPQLRDLLARYFETLRREWRREAETLALTGLSSTRYSMAVARAREAALEAALKGVDVDDLEARFYAWVEGLDRGPATTR